MVHSIRALCLLITVCCVLLCSCTRYSDNTETPQSTQNDFEQSSNITSNFNLDDQLNDNNETMTDSIQTDQPESTSASSVTTASTAPYTMSPSDIWYKVGFEYNEEFVIPKNWLSIMTSEEAFEHFDEIIDESQSEKNVSEIIQNLMNRNVIAFEILYGRDPAYESIKTVEPSDENHSLTTGIRQIRSDYFNCLNDINNIMTGTYIQRLAYERLNGAEGERVLFFEEDGKLFVDYDSMYYWSSDPYTDRTFIEILDSSESECIFVWHYIAWEHWDYEDNDTYVPHPYPMQKKVYAVIEDNEWRLTSIVFDNPEY